MKDKPFEIFKAEHFDLIDGKEGIRLDDLQQKNIAWEANRTLNAIGKRGYTVKVHSGNICHTIFEKIGDKDTHEALVFLRPIEEECDHKATWEEFSRLRFVECPKCGDKIK